MEIKKLIYDEVAILNLYNDNGWYAYTKNPDKLFKGIKQSLDIIGVYDGNLLVGLIRTVGDSETIIYIQDILILKEYQGKGLGTKLVKSVLDKYKEVRQIMLTTDDLGNLRSFYESLGFKEYKEENLLGYYYDN